MSGKTTKSKLQGTPLWMAPEVIKGECEEQGWLKADIWSVGCTVIEMITGQPPWHQFTSPMAAMFNIASDSSLPDLPSTISHDALDLITICLQRDPSKRPSVTALLMHPFVVRIRVDSMSIFPPIDTATRPQTSSGRELLYLLIIIDLNHGMVMIYQEHQLFLYH